MCNDGPPRAPAPSPPPRDDRAEKMYELQQLEVRKRNLEIQKQQMEQQNLDIQKRNQELLEQQMRQEQKIKQIKEIEQQNLAIQRRNQELIDQQKLLEDTNKKMLRLQEMRSKPIDDSKMDIPPPKYTEFECRNEPAGNIVSSSSDSMMYQSATDSLKTLTRKRISETYNLRAKKGLVDMINDQFNNEPEPPAYSDAEMKMANMHIDLINHHIKQLKDKIEKYKKDSLYIQVYDEEKQVIRTQYSLVNRSNLILDRFTSSIVDISDVKKDSCDVCKIYTWTYTLTCSHKLCAGCYRKDMNAEYKIECVKCHRLSYNSTFLNSHQDIIGYKFIRVARINNDMRVLGEVGAILTLQIPTYQNNLYYSKVDSRWDPSKDAYLENTKYAAQKVIVVGVQFFGYDIAELMKVIEDYHKNRCILVSDFDPQFQYIVGMTHEDVKAGFTGHNKCDCCVGLHFFKDKPSAVSYSHGYITGKCLDRQPLFTKRLDDIKENTPLMINQKLIDNVSSNIKLPSVVDAQKKEVTVMDSIINSVEYVPGSKFNNTIFIVGYQKKVKYEYVEAYKRMVPKEISVLGLIIAEYPIVEKELPVLISMMKPNVSHNYMDDIDLKNEEVQTFIREHRYFNKNVLILPCTKNIIPLDTINIVTQNKGAISKLMFGDLNLDNFRILNSLGYNPNKIREEFLETSMMLFRNRVKEVPNVSRNIKSGVDESKLIDPITLVD